MSENRILLQDKPAAGEILVYWSVMGIVFAAVFVGLGIFLSALPLLRNLFFLFAFLALAFSVLRIVLDLLERQAATYTLTVQMLTTKRGLLNQRESHIPLRNIQSIHVRRPLLGQMLNYGSLLVTAAGIGQAVITRVPNPDRWVQEIQNQIESRA